MSNNIENPASTIWIFAHANAGKTTLTEQLLYHTKVIDIIWKVDDGNTITDSLNIEKDRWISVRSALVTFNINGKKIQLIDTPGHIDFSAEVERALNVLDFAVVVISWVEWIESQTYTLWELLKKKNIPTIIFINKMDRVWADFQRVIDEIKKKVETQIISLIDINKLDDENNFQIKEYNSSKIIELLAEIDDETLVKYIESPETITKEKIDYRLTQLIKLWKIFPIIWWSALKNDWMEKLISSLDKYIPSPKISKDDKFSWFIYLVRVDEWKRNYFTKILSWELKVRDTVNIGNDAEWKITALYKINWTESISVNTAQRWDIVIVNGIDSSANTYIWEQPEHHNHIKFINPLINMNVIPLWKTKNLELLEALNILNIEDPYLNVRYDKKNNQIIVSLMWEIQSQVIQTMLKERFDIDADFLDPVLIHKETPSTNWKWKASYTSISAVELEVKPLKTWSWVIYKSKLSTDFLLKKYQKQTERLVKEYLQQWIYWWEVTDIEVSLVDGRFDSMWSDPKHFNIAVPLALIRALKNSDIKIIEPIAWYTIIVPKNYMDSVISTLSNLNSKFQILQYDSDKVTIKWEAKYKDMLNFQNTLISITSWLWVYTSNIIRYEATNNQTIKKTYIWPDPRNETFFLINDMKWSFEALDKPISKKKKESSSKFKRLKKEKVYAKIRKDKSI